MFPKSKYNKSNSGSLNYKSNIGASNQSSRYGPNIYTKKKSVLSKKMSNNKFSNHTWKKQNSHNYNWNKENDKNYLNEQFNSKNDNNKYYYNYKEKKENKSYYSNKEYSYLYSYDNNEYSYKPKNSKKSEKKISIDYATTQSNSSCHEESNNNNQFNLNDNNNLTLPNENYNSNDSLKINIEEKIKNNQNINNNVTDLKNLNSNPLTTENINFILNSNIINNNNNIQINDSNKIIPESPSQILSPAQQKKNKKLKKNNKNFIFSSKQLDIKKCISSNIDNDFQLNNEPYNKFNLINNELLTTLINPVIENTEILQVNVKIAKDKDVVFKLRRFDDLFLTVKLFCEINSIEEKLIKPIITKALCTLNSIYQIYNSKLEPQNIKILKMINHLNNETSIDY